MNRRLIRTASLLGTAILLIANAGEACAEWTGKELLDNYAKATPEQRAGMDQVIAAEENGMSWYASASKFHIYCKPENLGLTGNQIMDILKREVDAEPLIGKQPYGLAILLALRQTFVCPGQERLPHQPQE